MHFTTLHSTCRLVNTTHNECTIVFYYLLLKIFTLQAFCDPAQGFGNAIYFVWCSTTIRARLKRLFCVIFYKMTSLCRKDTSHETMDEYTPLIEKKFKKTESMSITCSPSSDKKQPAVNSQHSISESDSDGATKPKYGSLN